MGTHKGWYPSTRWILSVVVVGVLIIGLGACGSTGSNTESENTQGDDSGPGGDGPGSGPGGGATPVDTTPDLSGNEEIFPSSISIASPLQTANAQTLNADLRLTRLVSTANYTAQIEAVADILNGTEPLNCGFEPENFFATAVNAACYGPSLRYDNHPDAEDAAMADGTLPGGDVGMWLETNTTGAEEACAAAQLNERMRGITLRGINALQVTASMKCVTNYDDALTFPSDPAQLDPDTGRLTVDVLDGMNAMAEVRGLEVRFTVATIDFTVDAETGETVYTYDLSFIYDANDDGFFIEEPIDITLVHRADAEGGAYQGRLSYTFNDRTQPNEGNCYGLSGNNPNVTRAGSFLYAKSSDEVHMDARFATYCGHDADALSNGLVDRSSPYSASNTDGWTDNFNWFTALFDPETLAGDFAYAWQAGFGDDNTRVFNVHLDSNGTTRSGTAFFGFGDDIRLSDGSIQGMVCNWAGPMNQHLPLTPAAQMQQIESSIVLGGRFVPTQSSIRYAPVNACEYNASTDNFNGDFLIDLDADDSLADETHGDIPNEMQTLDMDNDGSVDDTDGNGIPDVIEDAGFDLPGSPDNF